MSEHDFSLSSARDAAAAGALDTWVSEFLRSPGSDNAALAEQLSSPQRWWVGPVVLPFDQLHRLAGPPDEPTLARFDGDDLETVEEMNDSIEDGWEPPPLVVSCRGTQLVVEDGNHRIEGMRRAGRTGGWAIVAFEDADSAEQFSQQQGSTAG
ncbi:MAG: hypothetical protein ACK4V6_01995 [Microthrixaceae bacterium]